MNLLLLTGSDYYNGWAYYEFIKLGFKYVIFGLVCAVCVCVSDCKESQNEIETLLPSYSPDDDDDTITMRMSM